MLGEYYRILIAAALIPPALALLLVYLSDKREREPIGLLIKLFFRGLLAMVPILVLELLAEKLVSRGEWSDFGYLFLSYFCIPGFIEEGMKFWTLKSKTWRMPEFNFTFDAVVYSVFISLGFAAIENVLYVTASNLGTAIARALFAIPGHTFFGVFMGALYAQAKLREAKGDISGARRMLLRAYYLPAVLHGLYDFLLIAYGGWIFYTYFAVFVVLGIAVLRKAMKNDRPIHAPPVM